MVDLPDARNARPLLGSVEIVLIVFVVFAWSTSWVGVHLQLGHVPPEISVMWRFVLAAVFMVGWCLVRGEKLRGFTAREHLMFVGLGLTLFSMNFVLFYYGGLTLVSGMLSVVFALAAPGNVLMQSLVLKRPVPAQVVAGSIIGVFGVMALFAPEVMVSGIGHIGGLAVSMMGTIVFCTGNLISARVQERGVPLASATAWGMLYGAGILAASSALRGLEFRIDWSEAYIGSLIYLALVASVVAFMSYLSLLRRLGPARAGYLTVLFPVFALMISTVVEGYQWTIWSFAGVAAVAFGNVLVLWRR
ncbi:DMT family transporter [Terrihabitans sp. B22-R8]|uniref:DMT family transporter n=1 Tax=Terrihabitans sp. B22-R8 TaxID=3425128 RepID=UPI00403D535D